MTDLVPWKPEEVLPPSIQVQVTSILDDASMIEVVETSSQNDKVSLIASELKSLVNLIEKLRKDISDPFLQAQREIKAIVDKATKPLVDEYSRLGRISGDYVQKIERARREEEAKIRREAEDARRAEAAKQKLLEQESTVTIVQDSEDIKLAASLIPTVVVPVLPKGQKLTYKWIHEITNALKFATQAPHLLKSIEIKNTEATNQLVGAGVVGEVDKSVEIIPGVKSTWVLEVSQRAGRVNV